MKKPFKYALLPLIALSVLGCQTTRIADDVALLGLSPDLKPGTQIGVIQAEHCGIRVLGFGTSGDLTGLFHILQTRHKDVRYLTRVKLEHRYRQYVVWDHDCWVIRGISYQ